MNSRLALDVFACILVVAGPVLFIVFCMSFKEDRRNHPIYRRTESKPYEADCQDEMPIRRLGS